MKRLCEGNRKLVALALLAGAGGACSNTADEDASNATGQEEYVQQIQAELDAAVAADPATASSLARVKPILKCVDKLANNQYVAHFGFSNTGTTSVSIPVGFFNRFWPPPISRGQPTTFPVGTQVDVVQVPFSGFSASIWILGTHFSVATKFAKLCPAGGTGGNGAGGSGVGGNGTGGRGVGGMGTGGVVVGTGGRGVGGNGVGGMGTGGVVMGTGGRGVGGNGVGGNGTGGTCGATPTNCDDQNPCTIDTIGVDANNCPVCVNMAALNGTSCNDGNACTTVDTCVSGACVGGSPKTCTPLDACHIAGVCAPATGACSNPAAPNGTTCSDGNACTQGDICTDGICTMGSPILCNAPDVCHMAGTCNPSTGTCTGQNAPDGTTCNDSNACTGIDQCLGGVCTGTSPKSCPATDQCHIAGVCDPANGNCSNPAAPNGATCSDGNACTTGETCQAGACTGGTAKVCSAADTCHVAGVCAPATGVCSTPNAPNGTTCTDNNSCTTADSCQAGVCAPGTPVVCPPPANTCQIAGTCNPTTGVCSSGNKPDGSSCDDGNTCSTGDSCQAGTCVAMSVTPPSECVPPACTACTFGPTGNCFDGTDGCQAFTGADRTLCEDLYVCLVAATHPGTTVPGPCISQGDPLACWCGTNGTTCTTDNPPLATAANGPCVTQIFAAAKSSDAATINQRFIDPGFPLGRAVNLAACRSNYCSVECSVNF